MTHNKPPREFWITESRCTGKNRAYKTQLECWDEIQHNDNEIHVREVTDETPIEKGERSIFIENQAKLIQSLQSALDEAEKALNRVLIKVDWNSDEFHDSKQYNETREIITDALQKLRASRGEK